MVGQAMIIARGVGAVVGDFLTVNEIAALYTTLALSILAMHVLLYKRLKTTL